MLLLVKKQKCSYSESEFCPNFILFAKFSFRNIVTPSILWLQTNSSLVTNFNFCSLYYV